MSNVPVTNELIEQVMAQSATQVVDVVEDTLVITPPTDNEFDLPGGYMSPIGEVALDAEVRELTGRDEEAISKVTTLVKGLNTVLSRGLIRVGEQTKIDDTLLNNMLAGDRDYVLLRIYVATFGAEVDVERYCDTCLTVVPLKVDLLKDVTVKRLDNPADRRFTVATSVGEVMVDLPTGYTQKELMAAENKTMAELSTLLLENTVMQVDGRPVVGKSVILDLSIRDRRKINEAIAEHTMGPQMQDVKAECKVCGSAVGVPLSIAALFQF